MLKDINKVFDHFGVQDYAEKITHKKEDSLLLAFTKLVFIHIDNARRAMAGHNQFLNTEKTFSSREDARVYFFQRAFDDYKNLFLPIFNLRFNPVDKAT